MIPADLLARLQEADPELYRSWENWQKSIFEPGQNWDRNSNLSHALLQWLLQEATRGRKWSGWVGRTERICFAEIHIKGAASRFENNEIFYGQGDTEAEALLRAYLAAIP